MESEVFVRSDVQVADVDAKQRLIDLLVVPWDQEADVFERGEWWHEVIRRGAFDGLEDHIGRVRVNREHRIGDTVGKLVWADPKAASGLLARAKIAKTVLGDDTLGLAEDDAISPSMGYRIKHPDDIRHDRRTRVREVRRAFLDHLGLVEAPTWEEARVLAVREKADEIETLNPPDFAVTLNQAWTDPEYLRAVERLNRSRAETETT